MKLHHRYLPSRNLVTNQLQIKIAAMSCLMFLIFMTSTAFAFNETTITALNGTAVTALNETSVTAPSEASPTAINETSTTVFKWDTFMKESLSGQLEYFALDKPTCLSDLHLGWVTYEKRSFKYVAESMNWASAEQQFEEGPFLIQFDKARRHCVNLGANLISIHSEDEYQLVKALIRAHDPSENPTWIGLSDCQELYQWVWSDGTKFNYTKWNPNEPNALNKECCVHMNFAKQKNWNDIPCEIKYPFVCVKKLA